MTQKLNWGILGTGAIAKTFAKGVQGSKTGTLVAVGSRSQEKADALGNEFKIPTRHASYEALLADANVQAVYIATPHPQHCTWAVKAAEAKKHLLVEKPIGLNFAEAMVIVEAAKANDVFLMEAFMYRCHPQIAKVIELIQQKAIGDVKMIQAAFSFHWPKPFNADSRLTSNALGGGGILDVGCYPISFARLIAGAARQKPFENPIEVKAVGHLESTGIDGYTAAVLKFPGDILAHCTTGVQLNYENDARIYGVDGSIRIPDPWIPARDGGKVKIILTRNGKSEEIEIETTRGLYSLEADVVAQYLDQRQASSPAMSWDDTLGNMRALDAWRSQIGVVYDSEKLDKLTQPLTGRPVQRNRMGKMKYGKIAGITKPVSRIAVGADFSGGAPRDAMAIFDDAFERGVNMFDTSWWYGKSDTVLGHWMNSRGVRDEVIFLGKGAHAPACNPKDLTRQLLETIDKAKIGYVDLYIMHRDNPDIPVGEFVEVLNEHKKAGRINAFGGSNWSFERMQAANDYAATRGLTPFVAMSNNFSLARMVNAVWDGCISASDPATRQWLEKTQISLVPWSSQARGFFTERAHRDRSLNDEEMNRCWYAEDNWQRRDRVLELAKKYDALPICIALAYVLCQPFPTFPLIGPRQISETRSSLDALKIELSPKEVKWLNLEGSL